MRFLNKNVLFKVAAGTKFRKTVIRNFYCSLHHMCTKNAEQNNVQQTNQIDDYINISVKGISLSSYLKSIQDQYTALKLSQAGEKNKNYKYLSRICTTLEERRSLAENIINLNSLLCDNDNDIRQLAKEEKEKYLQLLKASEDTLLNLIVSPNEQDLCNGIILEVNSGVGGQEAMLFANELFNMYLNFINNKNWNSELINFVSTDLGGIRHASISVEGVSVYNVLRHEAGVHRVQRIPSTEKSGRIHTSTASVLALPQPSEIQVHIEQKDLRIDTMRATGAGGQHVNTTDSAVRITHLPSALSVECQVNRSQIKNRQLAMTKLRALLYQTKLDQQIAESIKARKSQVKTNFRNEKIRTYNYNQDRITDHRVPGLTFHNIEGFLKGSELLGNMIERLDRHFKIEELLNIVNNENR